MSKEEILEKIQPIFASILNLEAQSFNENVSMDNTEKWDSLANIRIILEVEAAFDIKFSTANIEKIKSVKDILDFML